MIYPKDVTDLSEIWGLVESEGTGLSLHSNGFSVPSDPKPLGVSVRGKVFSGRGFEHDPEDIIKRVSREGCNICEGRGFRPRWDPSLFDPRRMGVSRSPPRLAGTIEVRSIVISGERREGEAPRSGERTFRGRGGAQSGAGRVHLSATGGRPAGRPVGPLDGGRGAGRGAPPGRASGAADPRRGTLARGPVRRAGVDRGRASA